MPEPEIDQTAEQIKVPDAPEAVESVIETDNSASEDAILDKLLGSDEPAPRRVDPTPEPSAPDPDFDRALKALQRDGVPADVIDSIRTDPSKVKEWGLKAAKRQADVDAFGSKVAEQRKSETKQKNAESKATEDKEDDADPLSGFSEMFGDEASKPLRALADKLRSEFDEKSRALETRYETQSAYQRIASEYGKDAPSYDEITEVAARVGRENPGKFDSISDVVREAFRLRAGEPRRIDPRNSARPTVGKVPPRPVKSIDKEDVVLNVLLSGGTRADALKAITR